MAEKKPKLSYQFNGKDIALDSVIDLDKDIWEKGGNKIITLAGLQKIAEKELIVEKEFSVDIKPSKDNHQQHVVTIWLGIKGVTDKDQWKRGSGEASVLNTGKITKTAVKTATGQIVQQMKADEYSNVDSKYKFAMAEKRAFSRALMKMVQLYGFYCEVEATAFANPMNTTPNTDGSSDIDY